MAWILAKQIATAILSGFDRHYRLFLATTAGARQRFEDADWEAVQRTARERIGYKAPEEIEFLDEMPLTATGKIDRLSLKRLAEARHSVRA